jgi:hypothetical protein
MRSRSIVPVLETIPSIPSAGRRQQTGVLEHPQIDVAGATIS